MFWNSIFYPFPIIIFFFLGSLIAPSSKVYAESNAYISEIITQAENEKLWEKRAWKKLLFIPDRFFSSQPKSLMSDKNFFLSQEGKINPKLELIETLKAFAEETPKKPDENYLHPQCRFPARFHWLVEELEINPNKMHFQPCPELHKFIDYLDYEGVSLVFSNYVADGPGTLFGHTFLRLHRNKDYKNESAILDDVANFAALIPAERDWLFAIKGLAGGYPGKFAVVPYYIKIQEYNNFESRDLWEYKLNLSKKEIRLLELILWEVGWTYIDYYYLDDNCAYVILAVLEAAKPELKLTENIKIYAIPSDTVRVVNRTPNLVEQITYRASVFSRYITRLSVLNGQERKILKEIVENNNVKLTQSIFSECHNQCKTRIIDTALEYIDYKEKLVGSNDAIEYGDLRKQLLISRAQTGEKSEPLVDAPTSAPPNQGHDSALISVSYGSTFSGTWFTDIRWRPALHDFESQSNGYSDALGVGFLDTILRADYTNKKVYLKNFHLLEITSLPAQIPNINFLTWHFDSGYEYGFGFGDAATQERGYLQLGYGLALYELNNSLILYSILHCDLGYSSSTAGHIGPTLSIGMIQNISKYFKFIAKSEIAKRFHAEKSIDSIKYSLNLAAYANKNLEFQMNIINNNAMPEASFNIRYYF